MVFAKSDLLRASQVERPTKAGLLREIGDFWRQFVVAAFDPYRPEMHYMRGPGPACHARRELSR